MIRRAAAAVVAAILTAGCTAADVDLDRADAPATTVADPSTTVPPDVGLAWSPCERSLECATVAVPLDHDQPDGPTIDVAVARRPATGDRIGPLFVNFGGPGAGAISSLGSYPFPSAIRDRFDIVAMDPRGVGSSSPLDCGLTPDEVYAVDHSVEDAADEAALLELGERFAADCEASAGDLLPHVGTRDVARDMDAVRAAMGDEELSYLGFSYGTSLGQAYAELFPDRVRAMVLDGLVDPAPSGLEVAVQQALGFEEALLSWAAACPSRGSCDLDDPLAAVDDMLAAAEAGLPASGGRTLGPGHAVIGLALPLYSELLWPALDTAIEQAGAGDGSGMLALAGRYGDLVDLAAYYAVSCLDTTWPTDPAEHLTRAAQAEQIAARFGPTIVNDYLRCAAWPAPADPLGAITAPDVRPLLLVSITGDPATPHANALTVADRIEQAVLVTVEGEGHTIVFQGNRCVDGIVLGYLVDLVVPGADPTC